MHINWHKWSIHHIAHFFPLLAVVFLAVALAAGLAAFALVAVFLGAGTLAYFLTAASFFAGFAAAFLGAFEIFLVLDWAAGFLATVFFGAGVAAGLARDELLSFAA